MDESNADCGPCESDEGCTDYFLDFSNWANEEAFERACNSHLFPVLKRNLLIVGAVDEQRGRRFCE